jgi:hypothetical protein
VHGEPVCLFTLSTEGRIYISVGDWQRSPELREGAGPQVLRDLSYALGRLERPRSEWPWFAADTLLDDDRKDVFFAAMESVADSLRASPPPNAGPSPASDEDRGEDLNDSSLNLRYQKFLSEVLHRFMAFDPVLATPPTVGARNWLPFGSGRSGFSFVWSIADARRVRVELYIDVGDRAANKAHFDALASQSDRLEAELGQALTWERLDHRKACRISVSHECDPSTFDTDPNPAEWAAETMAKFAAVFRAAIKAI